MKILSGNKGAVKNNILLGTLVAAVCFSAGLYAARFGSSAPLSRPASKPAVPTPRPEDSPMPVDITQAAKQSSIPPPAATHAPLSIGPDRSSVSPDAAPVVSPVVSRKSNPGHLPPITIAPQRTTPATPVEFGHSVLGRPLEAFVLGNGANTTMIFGDFHGNERSVPGVVIQLREYLQQHPERWLNCKVILVPYANPDGWSAGTRVNAHHVDINRNFPGTWQPVGRAARYSPGPAPDSEPETRAIEGLVGKYQPTKIVSIHQPLHMLNWTGGPGKKLAVVMQKANHYSMSDKVGYKTPGSFGDYCGLHNIAIVTMEMPQESVSAGWAENREALLAAINVDL